MSLFDQLQEAKKAITDRAPNRKPRVGVILGSGLGGFVDCFSDYLAIPYGQIPNFPSSSVPGHAGKLVFGRVAGEQVVAMQGRVHFYEGHSPERVAFPARTLCALGIDCLVVTNAAGGIRADLEVGDLMVITDHINLSGWNPLVGPNDERMGARFPDMSSAYSPALVDLLCSCAEKLGIALKKGVYAVLSGPSYETPAEIRALRALGADAVGMSTVPEVIVAAHMGVKVCGVSCISNLAAGIGTKPLSHEEVADTANRVKGVFEDVLSNFLPLVAAKGQK